MLRRFSRLLLGVFSLIILCVLSVALLQNRSSLYNLQRATTSSTSDVDPDTSQPNQQTLSSEQFLSYRRIG